MQDNNQQFSDFSQNQNFTNVPQQQIPPQQFSQQKPKKPIYKKWWFWVIIVIVVIAIISSLSSGNSDNQSTNEPNSVSSQADNNAGSKSDDVQAEEKTKDNSKIGDYKCVVKKAVLTKDYAKKDAVLITYEFTNNSDDSVSFDVALKDDVYQDGIALEMAITDDDTDTFDVKIKPGVTKEVTKAYKLRDTKTALDVEITELISFSDDKIVTTVKLQK